MATASIAPKALLEMLENATSFSLADNVPVNDTIQVQLDGVAGQLQAAGRGRFAACLDHRYVEDLEGSYAAILDAEQVQDMCKEVRKAKLSGARDFRVEVELNESGLIVTAPGGTEFTSPTSELASEVMSDDEYEGIYDHLYRMLEETRYWEAPTRMVMLRKAMKMLLAVKPGTPAKDDDPLEILVRPEGPGLNGLLTARIGPVRVLQVVSEVD